MKQVFGVLTLVALVVGAVVGTIGYQEWSVWSQGSEEPQVITLAELEQNGPGKNHHVTVANVDYAMRFVFQANKYNKWEEIWLPLVQDYRMNDPAIKVVLRSGKLKDQNDVDEFCRRNKSITGILTKCHPSLEARERQKLKEFYPNGDYDTVWVLDEGRRFPSGNTVYLALTASVVSMLLTAVFGFAWIVIQP